MLLAERVAAQLTGLSAYSLMSGYGVRYDSKRVFFPVGALLGAEKRNESGRVTRALYGYADGSRIEFTYSEARGAKVKTIAPKN